MVQKQSNEPERKGLLDDLSISQVVAGALAAVTSVTLSSKIGIAGSLIGVAVASVVSTVASQLYRGMLRRGSDKIRELASSDAAMAEQGNPYEPNGGAAPTSPAAAGDMTNAAVPRVAPAELRQAAHLRHQQEIHRRVMVAAIVSSLVAVLASAGIVMLATHGEGLGEHVSITSSSQAATTVAATTTHAAETREAAQSPTTENHTASTDSASSGDGNHASDGSTTSPSTSDASSQPATDEATTTPETDTADAQK